MPYLIIFIVILQVAARLSFSLPVPDAVVALIVTAIIRLMAYERSQNAKKFRKGVEHGSARWGTSADIAPYVDPKPENNLILTKTESLTMNSRPKPIKYARNKNILVIGGSGSGKTFFYVKPNLLQCESKDFPVSFIITDPKGQILGDVGKFLKDKGYRIKVLNTIDFKKSMKYNPFVYIRSEKDILKLVTALVENTKDGEGKSNDPFWEKAEKLLYQALIGYIWYELDEGDQNMNTLVEMINKMEVRENDDTFKNEVDFMFEELEERSKQHFAVRQYKKFKLSAGKTAKSILVSCGARLAPFDIAEVRDLMSRDDMELDKLGGYKQINSKTGKKETVKQKTALFVIISDTDSSFNFIVALLYSQLFNILCDTADNEFGGRLPVHVRCLLDEFAKVSIS
jgi:type IV secretion system protein VirD4